MRQVSIHRMADQAIVDSIRKPVLFFSCALVIAAIALSLLDHRRSASAIHAQRSPVASATRHASTVAIEGRS